MVLILRFSNKMKTCVHALMGVWNWVRQTRLLLCNHRWFRRLSYLLSGYRTNWGTNATRVYPGKYHHRHCMVKILLHFFDKLCFVSLELIKFRAASNMLWLNSYGLLISSSMKVSHYTNKIVKPGLSLNWCSFPWLSCLEINISEYVFMTQICTEGGRNWIEDQFREGFLVLWGLHGHEILSSDPLYFPMWASLLSQCWPSWCGLYVASVLESE